MARDDGDLSRRLAALSFGGPYSLVDGTWRQHVESGPIVYRLLAWDASVDGPRRIARANGADERGVLDIGKSGDGRRRIVDLLGAASGKPNPHRAGIDYHLYDLCEVFPVETLRVEVLQLESKIVGEAIEAALLEDYRWRFKDRPPLNGASGEARKVARWLRESGRPPRCPRGWLNIRDLLP